MRYLGGKSKILQHIQSLDIFNENNLIICDLFAGTGTVGDNFKENNIIISNDSQNYAYHLNIAKLKFKDIPSFQVFKKVYKIEIFKYLNELKDVENKKFFIRDNYSPKGNRMYFTESNAEKIDLIRVEIENLYVQELLNDNEYSFLIASLIESSTRYSNITGTYEAYLKHWDPRALKSFEIKPLEISITTKISSKNKVYNRDSNDLIKEIEGDILYLDPPYTVTEYASAYHILETISKYDIPNIKGITGRRQNRLMSKYTRKNDALDSLENIVKNAKFKKIVLSYSTQGIIPIEKLEKMLKKYAVDFNLQKIKINYREYKNIRESKKDKLYELIYVIEKDNKILQSPLNYSGSKYDLFNEMNKYFPNNISTFIDSFGGAFNVGVNIKAQKVIYNEYNKFAYNTIEMLLQEKEKRKLIKSIETIINKHGLSAGNKETYVKFREYYNNVDKSTINLFVLSMFCFQNQMRFNSKHEFNTPVGNCAYNETSRKRILKFTPKTKNYELLNMDFFEIPYHKYDKDSLFYLDPPYLMTKATYNDGKRGFDGWNSELEIKLLNRLLELDKEGYKFALSNVISHKGVTNDLLIKWAKEHNFTIIPLKNFRRKEILIINYELTKGVR